jgi:hypothetical protein
MICEVLTYLLTVYDLLPTGVWLLCQVERVMSLPVTMDDAHSNSGNHRCDDATDRLVERVRSFPCIPTEVRCLLAPDEFLPTTLHHHPSSAYYDCL